MTVYFGKNLTDERAPFRRMKMEIERCYKNDTMPKPLHGL